MHHDIQLFAEYAVTPFVGVWIETENTARQYETSLVTPFVGVWIETRRREGNQFGTLSHPSWVCGLKLLITEYPVELAESHPSWVCGLKLGRMASELCKACHTLRGCVD